MVTYSLGGTVSVTDVAQAVLLHARKHVQIINDGADEVYYNFEQDYPLSGSITADNTSFKLNSGESNSHDSETNSKGFLALNIRTANGETASIRYKAWL